MADTECLEITITHNLRDVEEVRELFIELVFSELDRTLPGGGWLIDRMLGSAAAEMPGSMDVAIDGV